LEVSSLLVDIILESGRLYAVGYNKYGQLGLSNSLYMHTEDPVEVFTDGIKVKKVVAGWHHNLILGEDGKLYGFGARNNG
jgi:alpha-tubulin suppressor-like RCC1 family protein